MKSNQQRYKLEKMGQKDKQTKRSNGIYRAEQSKTNARKGN